MTDDAEKESTQQKTHTAVTGEGSALRRYQDVVVGKSSLLRTIFFEFCSWLGPVPGALGLLLRKLVWPRLFGACGAGVQFGTGVILRHPHRIHLGQRVVLSEGVVLDARNADSERVLMLGDGVMLANNVILSCKGGSLQIGARTGVGAQTIIQSTNDCPVSIGADVIIGPRCYLVGGGNYHIDRLDMPIWRQGIKQDGGCRVDDDVWLGANVTVLGGVEIESGSVVAAGAVVNKSVDSRTIVGGVPARRIGRRGESEE